MPIVLTLGLVAAIMAGLMIAIAAALFSIIGGGLLFGSPFDPIVMKMLSRLSVDRIDNFLLLAVPFFILAGRLMNSGGVTVRLFDFIAALFSRFRGGLAHANVLASFIFAGMSGSATADVVGLGAIEMKAMRENGYDEGFSAGVTAASSILGPILPPSIVLIAYSVQAEQSVATMFLAAIGPGVLLAALFMIYVTIQAKRMGMPTGQWTPLPLLARKFRKAVLPMATPGIILAGIYGGIFTPTEAAAIAVLYALVLTMVIYRELDFRGLMKEIAGTALDTATLMFIIATTSAFGVIMLRLGLPQALAGLLTSVSSEPTIVLLMLLIVWLLVGCFMAQTPAIIILTPILLPIAQETGLDLVHFGMVMALSLTVGLLTPPVGMVLYALKKVANVPIGTLFRVSVPYVGISFCFLVLLVLVPPIITALPYSLGYR